MVRIILRYNFMLYFFVFLLGIACTTSSTVENQREPSSVMTLSSEDASKFSRNWINIPQSEINNTKFSLESSSFLGGRNFAFDVALTNEDLKLPNERLHLKMFIDDSIHNHKLGKYMAQVIHKAAWIWENSVNKDLFTIYDKYDESLLEDEELPNTHFVLSKLGNLILKIGEKTLVENGSNSSDEPEVQEDGPKFDGVSRIYYVQDFSKASWFPYGYSGSAYPLYDLDWGNFVKSFRLNKRILEADIVMNGALLEKSSNCHIIKNYYPEFLKEFGLLRRLDNCTLSKFMKVILHEMGHILMLTHSDHEDSVMNVDNVRSEFSDLSQYYDEGKLNLVDITSFRKSHKLIP